jgi:hypothetical protein
MAKFSRHDPRNKKANKHKSKSAKGDIPKRIHKTDKKKLKFKDFVITEEDRLL